MKELKAKPLSINNKLNMTSFIFGHWKKINSVDYTFKGFLDAKTKTEVCKNGGLSTTKTKNNVLRTSFNIQHSKKRIKLTKLI